MAGDGWFGGSEVGATDPLWEAKDLLGSLPLKNAQVTQRGVPVGGHGPQSSCWSPECLSVPKGPVAMMKVCA